MLLREKDAITATQKDGGRWIESIKKYSSKKSRDAINSMVRSFQKTVIAIEEVLAIGRNDSFSDKGIGNMVRRAMLAAIYYLRIIQRALPPSAKHIETTHHQQSNGQETRIDILNG